MGTLVAGEVYLVMGVSGSGKSTVARVLAARLGAEMLDADDFHPAANVAKMSAGIPLDDSDRAGWLARLNDELRRRSGSGASVTLACSALKERYRERLRSGIGVFRILYLRGDLETLRLRMAARLNHFMPPALLDSQLQALEEPIDALAVDTRLPVAEIVEEAVRAWRARA